MAGRGRDRWAAALAIALAIPAFAHAQRAPALADSVASEAVRLFQRGLAQLDAADFAGAVDSFERSLALRRSPAALYNLGLALRGIHAYGRASEVFNQLLALLGPEADGPVCSAARTIAAEMRQQMARVRFTVRGGSDEVSIDGRRVAQLDGTRDLDFDPGVHAFEVRRRGHEPQRVERALGPGERATVEIDAAAAPLPALLRVESDRPTADIRVDGVSRGLGTFAGTVAPTRHHLDARIGTRVVWQREATFEPGGGMRISLHLPAPPNAFFRNRWTWAGGAATVVVTALLIAIAAVPPPFPVSDSFGQTIPGLRAQ